jgi:transposase
VAAHRRREPRTDRRPRTADRAVDVELRRQGADHRYIPLLVTAPGFGWINAFTVASEIGDIARFASPAKLVGYTGLCPRVYQSGASDRRGPISKQGSRYLRWALFEAALHACNHPVYAERYQAMKRRLGRQRGPKVAQIASPASSPRRSGTCSPATSPSLRQTPVFV